MPWQQGNIDWWHSAGDGSFWTYRDGQYGYFEEIKQANKLHIGVGVLNEVQRVGPTNPYWILPIHGKTLIGSAPLNPVWHSNLIHFKLLRTIPLRYVF